MSSQTATEQVEENKGIGRTGKSGGARKRGGEQLGRDRTGWGGI